MGDRGEPDVRGPWNEGGDWELVHAPAFQELESELAGTRGPGNGSSSQNRTAFEVERREIEEDILGKAKRNTRVAQEEQELNASERSI